MAEFTFDNVRLVIGEPNRQVRHSLKSALSGQGFRDIQDGADYHHVQAAVAANMADAVICDASLPGGDICFLVHQLRHHKIGNNPFVLVFVTCADPAAGLVRRVADSGVDDILAKPISSDFLMSRIRGLARARKPFLVTHDYIGPDRRALPRRDDPAANLVNVPNPLRSKAVANVDGASLQRMVQTAAARINIHKMERYAAQVGFLVEQIVPRLPPCADTAAQLRRDLNHLGHIAGDLAFRLRGTPYAHVGELALSLGAVVERLRATLRRPDSRDIDLLPKIAQAFARAFTPEQETVRAAQQISASVSGFAGRSFAL